MKVSKKALSLVLATAMVLSAIPNSLVFASAHKYKDSAHDSDIKDGISTYFEADSGYKDSQIAVTGIELDQTILTLENGESKTLNATITPDDATDQEIYWTTSASSICTVDQNGKVTAVGNGSAVITVITHDGGFSAKCKVNVVTTITGISLNKTKMNLAKGETELLTATVTPSGSPEQDIHWSSSDEKVCIVDSSGNVTAVSTGATVISATITAGYTATCMVTVTDPVTGISLNKTALSLNKGKSETLKATVTPSDASDQDLSWASSNSKVCTVDQNGKVTAVNNGSAIITVMTYDGAFTAKCDVTVITPVTGITLNKSTTTISKGSEETLIATVTPSDASNTNVIWASTNSAVCTVDSSGTVSALSDGTAIIIATTVDGGHMAYCVVTVDTAVAGISLNKTDLELQNGQSESLIASLIPDDATVQDVSWSTSNKSVCTVDQDGKVTAVGNGVATITVMTYDGAFTATCKVTVTTPVTGITLDKTSITLSKGTKDSLTATVTPAEATEKSIVWASSDDNICAVDSDGNICAMNAGNSVITVTTKDGGYTAKCTVTVVIPVTGVTLNKSNLTMEKGSSEALTATVIPEDATDRNLFWTSSNSSVCTVDQNGKVTAKGNGTAVITVSMHDGGYSASCDVTVMTSVTGISLNKSEATLVKGSKAVLTATVTPSDASTKDVLWSSSDDTVCSVDSNGNLSALDVGSAVITATTKDGGFTAKCTVTVVIPVAGVTLNKTATSIMKGNTEKLTAAITPEDATDQALTWASSDEKVAVVDKAGNVTAIGVGTATVTVTSHDGGYTAQCSVTVTPNQYAVTADAINGSVTGVGTYNAGSAVTLTETPVTGYHFVSWTDSNGNQIGTDSTYTISSLDADTTITANFAINTYTVTATAGTGGTVSGGGTYNYGSTCTLTATANAGYHFVSWSDGNSSAARSFTVSESMILSADFAIDPVSWTYSVSERVSSGGTLGGYGNSTGTSAFIDFTSYDQGGGMNGNCEVTYTFNEPLRMKSGQTLTITPGPWDGGTHGVEVKVNGTSVFYNSQFVGGAVAYTFSSDITIDNISVDAMLTIGHSFSDINRVCVTVNSDAGSFMLNNSGTSANQ